MRYKFYILLSIVILACEFSEENLQGPPYETKKSDDSSDSDEENNSDEFIASIEDTEDGATALKIVAAPDLSKENEKRKGLMFLSVFVRLGEIIS
ncbi:hypothetical protein QE152_g5344 [Popillia japonica]|uniref:Uncharacterized protein n=1 Tax=Popillia japonica TaxID=7064 RepID=A0AAW1MNM4_POPJA